MNPFLNLGTMGIPNFTPAAPNKDSLVSQKNYLLNQINDIDSQLAKFEAPAATAAPAQPVQDISKLVAAEVQKQLAGLQQQVVAAAQASPDVGILRAMGEVLPESEQIWLRDNLAGLPAFLASEDGRGVVELLVESYRKSVK